MSRWLDLARAPKKVPYPCDSVTKPDKTQPEREDQGFVTFCHVSHGEQNKITPDTDAFEERAAICEYDGGYSREHAEDLAARSQGYNNVVAFRSAQQKLRGAHE